MKKFLLSVAILVNAQFAYSDAVMPSDYKVAFDLFVRIACNNPNSGIICADIYEDSSQVIAHFDVPDSPTVRLRAFDIYQGFEEARKALNSGSRVGDNFVEKLEWAKDRYNYISIACQASAAACVSVSAWISGANPALGAAGIVICGGAGAICKYSQDKFNKVIDELIAKIKAACAEGDEKCYDAVIEAAYPNWKTDTSDSSTTSDGQGSSTGGPNNQTPSPVATEPQPTHSGEAIVKETPPSGGEPKPIGGGDKCKANPKATGCGRPPKQEM